MCADWVKEWSLIGSSHSLFVEGGPYDENSSFAFQPLQDFGDHTAMDVNGGKPMNPRPDDCGRVIETDILILGSGAAGCGAAIGAREHGARVVLVDKGKIESSGGLGGGNDHFMAVFHSGPETDTEEAVINFYKGPTSGYTPKMISRWVRRCPLC